MSLTSVARHFNLTRSIIQRLLGRVLATGTVRDRARSGRPRALTQAPSPDNCLERCKLNAVAITFHVSVPVD